MTKHPLQPATTLTASLRNLAIAGLAGASIALAAAPAARADHIRTPHGSDADVVTQEAAVPSAAAPGDTAPVSREYLIKAALLFNFAKFAEWPAASFTNDSAPLRICVIGDDPFGPALDSLLGKQVRNRPIAVTRIVDVQSTPQCHILFVSDSEQAQVPAILAVIGTRPILTVADMDRFANAGGVVALKKNENRSRIEINVGAAKQAGLKLSSKLLRLADTVGTRAALKPVPLK